MEDLVDGSKKSGIASSEIDEDRSAEAKFVNLYVNQGR
jgi:hypothetical protein